MKRLFVLLCVVAVCLATPLYAATTAAAADDKYPSKKALQREWTYEGVAFENRGGNDFANMVVATLQMQSSQIEQMAGIKAKKRAILEEANAEAADILRKSNATIERTIREIKEAKAEKKATQAARQKVENLKTKVQAYPQPLPKGKGDKKESFKVEKQKNVLRDLSELKFLTKNPAKLIQEQGTKSQEQRRISNVADELRKKKLSFQRELDIRGLRADEALEVLIAYVDDALMVNAEQVTILHGTGTGALKQVVRDYLAERQKSMRRLNSGDISFHDGDLDRGGAGITVVEL